jgi:hypothetical protein
MRARVRGGNLAAKEQTKSSVLETFVGEITKVTEKNGIQCDIDIDFRGSRTRVGITILEYPSEDAGVRNIRSYG